MVILGTKVASATMAATGPAVTMDIINHGARIAYVQRLVFSVLQALAWSYGLRLR